MAKKNTRTANTIFNFVSSMGGLFITILLQFIVRTVFINTLGKSYLGISDLFSNILSMLSLAELGVGNAILFKLYDPIVKEDHRRIMMLMKFYKTAYTYIGIIVGVIGLCLIPFLPNLIKGYEKLETLNINAAFIFILYLLQSVSSYLFFAYKSAIVKANQKEYLLNLVKYITTVGSSIIQVVLLILLKNFNLYVVVLVFTVIMENIAYAIIANRLYPYINDKTDDTLAKEEAAGIAKDCSALLLYRLNGVVIKSTDNIVLSVFLGLDMVALYSNYYVFYTTIKTLFEKVFSSVAHSIGNLHTTHDIEHEYKVFESVNLISALIGGTALTGIFCVADEFIHMWIGDSWIIPQPFAFLMGLEMYTMSIRKALGKYRTAMGLFQQAKYRPLAGMIINLVVSVALVNCWGICGVLAGTVVADWITFMWFDPIILHKYGFKKMYSIGGYYLKTIKYFAATLAIAGADYIVCTNIMTGFGWFSVIVHTLICGITVPAVFIVLSLHTDEGKYVLHLGTSYVKKFQRKILKR